MSERPVVVIGAGPSGLAAAHELVAMDIRPLVLEAGSVVGGIARTVTYKGHRFDIGGHRFFTKIGSIHRLWQAMLGPDFLAVQRRSSILYNGRFHTYPLRAANTLKNLGVFESSRVLMSYIHAQLFPNLVDDTFEKWMTNRFGRRLFRIFFKTYTEKVWGLPCSAIQADWAAQRIKGLTMLSIVAKALFGAGFAKTLIDSFYYPKAGPGMMWDRFQEAVIHAGGKLQTQCAVTGLKHHNRVITSLRVRDGGNNTELPVDQVISSMPLTNLLRALDPAPPVEVLAAAEKLSYRAFVMVGLILNRADLFPEQWIYVHDADVSVGRIQNFKNWSPDMVADSRQTNIGMEYFCDAGDAFWDQPDRAVIDLAAGELGKLGLARGHDIVDGVVIRQPKAYPVYDQGYQRHLEIIRRYLHGFENLQTIGRNGTHRYNNMDHSMQSGILAAGNVRGKQYDLWQVNEEPAYHEELDGRNLGEPAADDIVTRVFTRMDKGAFGAAVGVTAGLIICLATLWLVIKGGVVVGPRMALLSQFFWGYTVTFTGAVIGFLYGFMTGFCGGWVFAGLRNFLLAIYLFKIRKTAEYNSLKDLLDRI